MVMIDLSKYFPIDELLKYLSIEYTIGQIKAFFSGVALVFNFFWSIFSEFFWKFYSTLVWFLHVIFFETVPHTWEAIKIGYADIEEGTLFTLEWCFREGFPYLGFYSFVFGLFFFLLCTGLREDRIYKILPFHPSKLFIILGFFIIAGIIDLCTSFTFFEVFDMVTYHATFISFCTCRFSASEFLDIGGDNFITRNFNGKYSLFLSFVIFIVCGFCQVHYVNDIFFGK